MWGILAMLMRFVPFIGAYIAAAPPVILAAIVEPGWTTFILTAGLYLVSELVMGQIVEPLAYGHGTGLTPLAIVIATVVWTWLWGRTERSQIEKDRDLGPFHGRSFISRRRTSLGGWRHDDAPLESREHKPFV